jgi:hypothetical protein
MVAREITGDRWLLLSAPFIRLEAALLAAQAELQAQIATYDSRLEAVGSEASERS